MDAQTMEHLRTKLLNRREMWLGRQGRLLAEQRGAPSGRADEWGHVAGARTEGAPLNGAVSPELQALERIEASLDRIAKGTYGKCVVCRGAIETERLRAMPDVTRCGGCTH